MKAIFFEHHGDADVLRYGDLPDPVPAPGEALIKVTAVSLNHLDIWVRRGWPGLKLAMPHITGSDVVGEVVLVNAPSVWQPGTKVMINPGVTAGDDEWTRRGEESVSPGYRILGEQMKGGMAQYVCVPVQNVFKVPEGFSDHEAAASLLVGTTCWRMLFTKGNLRPGESVLVVGAGGGVNSLAIMLAKAAGATVYALTSSKDKARRAKEIGADEVICTDEPALGSADKWHLEIFRMTKGRGIDMVIDNVGEKTLASSLRCVARGGRIITVGNTSGHNVTIDNRLLFTKQVSLIGSTMGSRQDFLDAMTFMLRKNIRPIIDRVEPLANGVKMLQYLEEGKQFGKIVLKPW